MANSLPLILLRAVFSVDHDGVHVLTDIVAEVKLPASLFNHSTLFWLYLLQCVVEEPQTKTASQQDSSTVQPLHFSQVSSAIPG